MSNKSSVLPLEKARQKASERHRALKKERVDRTIKTIDSQYGDNLFCSTTTIEIALAMLYLGEGMKSKGELRLGNSDPKVVRFYINAINRLYGVLPSSLRIELHLRADQDESAARYFWSKELEVPISHFNYVLKDKRTIGKPTREGYMGVCLVAGGGVEIQRRILYLAEVVCKKVTRG